MEVLFHLFRYHWGTENRSSYGAGTSLYRGSTVLPCKNHLHLKLSRVMI